MSTIRSTYELPVVLVTDISSRGIRYVDTIGHLLSSWHQRTDGRIYIQYEEYRDFRTKKKKKKHAGTSPPLCVPCSYETSSCTCTHPTDSIKVVSASCNPIHVSTDGHFLVISNHYFRRFTQNSSNPKITIAVILQISIQEIFVVGTT